MENLETTCVNRFLEICKECKRDYNPNNYECPNYQEMRVGKMIIKEKIQNEKRA